MFYDFYDGEFSFFKLILFIIQIISFCFLVYFVIYCSSFNSSSTRYIQSVVLDNSYNGSFILGTGTLDGTSYFVAYEIQEDGGKILKKYDSSLVVVYDDLDHGDMPYIDKTMSGFLGFDLKFNFHVPKDTINKNLDINLSNLK